MEFARAGTTSLTDYREIDEVLRSSAFVQAAYPPVVQPLVHDTLTAIDGPRHRARWRLESKLFGREALGHYKRDAVEPLLDRALAELRASRAASGVVRADLVPLFWGIARRIPAFVVGIDDVDDQARIDRLVELLAALGHGFSASQSPHRDELIGRALAARAAFATEFFEPSAARRRAMLDAVQAGSLPPEALPRDLITLLLAHPDESWDGELVLREAAIFLSASITTTAQFFPHFVLRVLGWVDEHPEDRPLLVDAEFLQGAVAEALRFIVASPARLRTATRDVVLRSGRRIAAGETVSLWFLPANRDPAEFGADAERFDPHRRTGKRAPWGLAFGQGAHLCIGKNLITGVGPRLSAADDASDGSSDASGADADDSGTDAIHGIVATVAQRLFAVGMTIDPERPAAKHPTSIYDEYLSLPVLFTAL